MDCTIVHETAVPYYHIELSGQFELDDLERCYVEILQHPDWVPGLDILWDAQKCTFQHLQRDELDAIANMTEKYREQRGAGRAAWVVSTDIDFGISRMFENMNQRKVVFDFSVFMTLPEAKEYLANKRQDT